MLLRIAAFGGASVPLAILAFPSQRKIAGETPAPPTCALYAGQYETEVQLSRRACEEDFQRFLLLSG